MRSPGDKGFDVLFRRGPVRTAAPGNALRDDTDAAAGGEGDAYLLLNTI